ncbi:hypothetical protein GMRT_12276 [Giardia muris]|uniref:Uncharacterized protein n=1 Tax=Giardia muris TaxID=5742 RepID=A0A4Z1T4H2_GIAMU|nr:hypothetical protein GMRT_12276 [Giardia muris]|eukprot:TNJ30568.1 hypothetical protein GMRT_12276 [Giardia muris]
MLLIEALVPLTGRMETVRSAQIAAYAPSTYTQRVRARFFPTRLTLEPQLTYVEGSNTSSLPSQLVDSIVKKRAVASSPCTEALTFAEPNDYTTLSNALSQLEERISIIQRSHQALLEGCEELEREQQHGSLGGPLKALTEAVERLEEASLGLYRYETAVSDAAAVLERVPRLSPLAP